ncbi:MAG: SHOCT domain-containing protein [Eubacterium sp.]|nr:SHOCT domain-containing protein [Eubacterium sp.]
MNADIIEIKYIAENDTIIENDSSKSDSMKNKLSSIKNAGTEISGLFNKLSKKIGKSTDEDPIETVKKMKSLLDIGAITQEEFDAKKKELLNL